MSVQPRAALKSYFNTGDKPTEAQFGSLIDSFWHKSEDTLSVAWGNVSGKPSEFAPSAHTHFWADITDKPTTFAPDAHVHSAGEINSGLFHPSRIGAGVTTDGYMIQMVSGVPTWVVAPSGGGSGISGLTTGFIPRANSSTSIINSQIQDNGSYIGIGGAPNSSNKVFAQGGSIGVVGGSAYDNPGGGLGSMVLYAANGFAAGIQSYNTHPLALNPFYSNVGVGTEAPAYKLDINGTARIVTVPTIVTATKMLVKDPTTGQVSEQLIPGSGSGWGLSGEAGTVAGSNYVGTSDAVRFDIRANNTIFGKLSINGAWAFGELAQANGFGNMAMGHNAITSTANHSMAFGTSSQATALRSMAFGANSISNHTDAIVISSGTGRTSTRAGQTIVEGQTGVDVLGAGVTMKVGAVSGVINVSSRPVYVDNAAALAGGLVSGDGYKTPIGQVMEVI